MLLECGSRNTHGTMSSAARPFECFRQTAQLVVSRNIAYLPRGKIKGSNCLRRFSETIKPLLTYFMALRESSRKVVGSVITRHSLATSGDSSTSYAVSTSCSLPYSARIFSRIGFCVLQTAHALDPKYTIVGLFVRFCDCRDARFAAVICLRFVSNNTAPNSAATARVINNRSNMPAPFIWNPIINPWVDAPREMCF
jgi:hypothetical protein